MILIECTNRPGPSPRRRVSLYVEPDFCRIYLRSLLSGHILDSFDSGFLEWCSSIALLPGTTWRVASPSPQAVSYDRILLGATVPDLPRKLRY